MVSIPSRWVIVDSKAGTLAIRGKRGRFKGRKHISGRGDGTHITRASRDIDFDKDGKVDVFGGTFLGRTSTVRASRRSRAFERRV